MQPRQTYSPGFTNGRTDKELRQAINPSAAMLRSGLKIQERALRIVFDDFSTSYEILCERANTQPLSFYRIRFLGIEMYKCVNGFNPTYLNDLFTAQSNDYHLRDSSRLIQPKFNTFKFGFKSFKYFDAKLWNVLPIDIKRSESLSIFKRSITAWCHSDAATALERKMF